VNTNFGHTPVLLDGALDGLSPRADGAYVDATFGRGGHTRALLARLGPAARVTVFDRDVQAIKVALELAANDLRVTVVHDNYAVLGERLPAASMDGVLFDLGVSSPQIDDAERGMSFSRDGPLDMRMDQSQGLDASGWLAQVDAGELERVLRDYGDERRAKALARTIVETRQDHPLTRTSQLADLCWRVIGKHEDKHPATRTFQAIRIHINDELGGIQRGLEGALHALKVGGRLAVIAFHSLEDRIVKQYFNQLAKAPPADRRRPPSSEFVARLKLIGKAQFASSAELIGNPRARSAVLRVAEKLA
jgi:16S rRNA (cytosine1402-N4)-methyltransferase